MNTSALYLNIRLNEERVKKYPDQILTVWCTGSQCNETKTSKLEVVLT